MVSGFAQAPLKTVQTNWFSPMLSPFTTVLGSFAFAKTPVPLTTVHVPVAGTIRLLPESVVLVNGVHTSWSMPALASGLFAS